MDNAIFTVQLSQFFGVVAQLVRAPACHAGGREFKSRLSRHLAAIFNRSSSLFLRLLISFKLD